MSDSRAKTTMCSPSPSSHPLDAAQADVLRGLKEICGVQMLLKAKKCGLRAWSFDRDDRVRWCSLDRGRSIFMISRILGVKRSHKIESKFFVFLQSYSSLNVAEDDIILWDVEAASNAIGGP